MIESITQLLSIPWIAITLIVLLAVLVVAVIVMFVYAIWQGREVSLSQLKIGAAPAKHIVRIQGRRLFQYKGYYPIDLDEEDRPSLNPEIYLRAVRYFLHDKEDWMAAMDLVYLREDNQEFGDVLSTENIADYERLIAKYDLAEFREHYCRETERLFRNYIRIVNDLGETLRGTNCEILLHDVRNPLRSIIAAKNTEDVSRRHLYGPSTKYVVQYLKHQGGRLLVTLQTESIVAYPKELSGGKNVKATTIPLFDEKYGLVGIICFNIDVDAIGAFNPDGHKNFFENYKKTTGKPIQLERRPVPIATL